MTLLKMKRPRRVMSGEAGNLAPLCKLRSASNRSVRSSRDYSLTAKHTTAKPKFSPSKEADKKALKTGSQVFDVKNQVNPKNLSSKSLRNGVKSNIRNGSSEGGATDCSKAARLTMRTSRSGNALRSKDGSKEELVRRSSRQASRERRVWSKQRLENTAAVPRTAKTVRPTRSTLARQLPQGSCKKRPGRPPKKKMTDCVIGEGDMASNNASEDGDESDVKDSQTDEDSNHSQQSTFNESKKLCRRNCKEQVKEEPKSSNCNVSTDDTDSQKEEQETDEKATQNDSPPCAVKDDTESSCLVIDPSQSVLSSVVSEFRDRGQQKFDNDVKLTSLIIREGLQQPSLLSKVLTPFTCHQSSLSTRPVVRASSTPSLLKASQDRISKAKVLFKTRLKQQNANRTLITSAHVRNRKKTKDLINGPIKPGGVNNVPSRGFQNSVSSRATRNIVEARRATGTPELETVTAETSARTLEHWNTLQESEVSKSSLSSGGNSSSINFISRNKVDAASSLLRKFRLSAIKSDTNKDRKASLKMEATDNSPKLSGSKVSAPLPASSTKKAAPAEVPPRLACPKNKDVAKIINKSKERPLAAEYVGPVDYIPELPIASTISKLKARVQSKAAGFSSLINPSQNYLPFSNSDDLSKTDILVSENGDLSIASSASEDNCALNSTNICDEASSSVHSYVSTVQVEAKKLAADLPSCTIAQSESLMTIDPSSSDKTPSTDTSSGHRVVPSEIILPSTAAASLCFPSGLLSPGSPQDGKVSLNAALAELIECDGVGSPDSKQTLTIHPVLADDEESMHAVSGSNGAAQVAAIITPATTKLQLVPGSKDTPSQSPLTSEVCCTIDVSCSDSSVDDGHHSDSSSGNVDNDQDTSLSDREKLLHAPGPAPPRQPDHRSRSPAPGKKQLPQLIKVPHRPLVIRTPLKCPDCPMQFCTVRSLLWHFGSHEGLASTPSARGCASHNHILLDGLEVPWQTSSMKPDPSIVDTLVMRRDAIINNHKLAPTNNQLKKYFMELEDGVFVPEPNDRSNDTEPSFLHGGNRTLSISGKSNEPASSLVDGEQQSSKSTQNRLVPKADDEVSLLKVINHNKTKRYGHSNIDITNGYQDHLIPINKVNNYGSKWDKNLRKGNDFSIKNLSINQSINKNDAITSSGGSGKSCQPVTTASASQPQMSDKSCSGNTISILKTNAKRRRSVVGASEDNGGSNKRAKAGCRQASAGPLRKLASSNAGGRGFRGVVPSTTPLRHVIAHNTPIVATSTGVVATIIGNHMIQAKQDDNLHRLGIHQHNNISSSSYSIDKYIQSPFPRPTGDYKDAHLDKGKAFINAGTAEEGKDSTHLTDKKDVILKVPIPRLKQQLPFSISKSKESSTKFINIRPKVSCNSLIPKGFCSSQVSIAPARANGLLNGQLKGSLSASLFTSSRGASNKATTDGPAADTLSSSYSPVTIEPIPRSSSQISALSHSNNSLMRNTSLSLPVSMPKHSSVTSSSAALYSKNTNTLKSINQSPNDDEIVMINPSLGLRIVSTASSKSVTSTTNTVAMRPAISSVAPSSNTLTFIPSSGDNSLTIVPQVGGLCDSANNLANSLRTPDILTIVPQMDETKMNIVASKRSSSSTNSSTLIMTAAGKMSPSSRVVKLVLVQPNETKDKASNSEKAANHRLTPHDDLDTDTSSCDDNDSEDEGMVIDDGRTTEEDRSSSMDPLTMCSVTLDDEHSPDPSATNTLDCESPRSASKTVTNPAVSVSCSIPQLKVISSCNTINYTQVSSPRVMSSLPTNVSSTSVTSFTPIAAIPNSAATIMEAAQNIRTPQVLSSVLPNYLCPKTILSSGSVSSSVLPTNFNPSSVPCSSPTAKSVVPSSLATPVLPTPAMLTTPLPLSYVTSLPGPSTCMRQVNLAPRSPRPIIVSNAHPTSTFSNTADACKPSPSAVPSFQTTVPSIPSIRLPVVASLSSSSISTNGRGKKPTVTGVVLATVPGIIGNSSNNMSIVSCLSEPLVSATNLPLQQSPSSVNSALVVITPTASPARSMQSVIPSSLVSVSSCLPLVPSTASVSMPKGLSVPTPSVPTLPTAECPSTINLSTSSSPRVASLTSPFVAPFSDAAVASTSSSSTLPRNLIRNFSSCSSERLKYQQRKYVCPHCSRRFGWSTDLKRHIILHTGERPFKCDACQTTFTRKFLLQNHTKRVHLDKCRPSDLWPLDN